MSAEAKCNCNHCSQPISFPAEGAGTTISCPHCGLDTILFIPPPPPKPEAPKNFISDKKPETKPVSTIQQSNRSQFTSVVQIMQLAALICIAGFMYYDWHQKQIVLHDPLPDLPVPKWEYQTFEWQPEQFDADHPNQIKVTVVHRDSDKELGGDMATNGMEAGDLTILLNHIGIEGWELVAFDGTRYIVKRPYNQNTEHDFSVESHWEQLKK
jgi:hypothetical protein